MQHPEYLTVALPCLTIVILVIFFAAYFVSCQARPGTLEWIYLSVSSREKPLFHRFPLGKKDTLPLLLITVLYAVVAFWNLGDNTAPQTFFRFTDATPSVTLELRENTDVSGMMYYSGLVHGHYILEVSQDGSTWVEQLPLGNAEYAMNQSHADLFKWQYMTMNLSNPPVRYIRITASEQRMQLGEIALYDRSGNLLPADLVANRDQLSCLLDEQITIPEMPTYLNGAYFDEIYHARTAYEHFTGQFPYEITHPPLGKLIIAVGISQFGMTPFGWRFMGTLFGVLMVAILYIFIKNLFGKTPVAVCGTLIFAFDFMHYTQTRIATIDTYSVFFILLMYWFMYRFVTVDLEAPFRKTVLPLFLCGLSFGLGAASKWTCLYAGAGLLLIYCVHIIRRWIYSARHNQLRRFVSWLVRTLLLSLVFFIVIPCAIYYLCYIPYGLAAGQPFNSGRLLLSRDYLNIVLENQKYMFHYHSELVATHAYSSSWYEWLLDLRPILYYVRYPADGIKSTFGAFGNPIFWWGGLMAIPVIVWHLLRYGDKKAGFILVGYLSQLLPWIFVPRITFIYHYFPSTVFLALALAYIFDGRYERKRGSYRFAVIGFTVYSVLLFVLFYPVLSGLPVPEWYDTYILNWLPRWPF